MIVAYMQQTYCGVWELSAPANSLLGMALWNVEWLVKTRGSTRSVPAFDFLLEQPSVVRMQLLAIVDAVRTTGPDRWRDTNSHDSMHGSCEHLHEARDKHGQMLYRLYLLWQRDHKRVVIIDGAQSPTPQRCPTPSTTTWPHWRQPPTAIPLLLQ
jgi:hypothetical protein